MEIDEVGIDKVGIDKVGIDEVGINYCSIGIKKKQRQLKLKHMWQLLLSVSYLNFVMTDHEGRLHSHR